jgi:hypothetical protein
MKIKNEFYVYHLVDGETNTPFYVGKGKGGRLYEHLNSNGDRSGPILKRKIKKMINDGKSIVERIIKNNLTEKEAHKLEKSEIKKYGRLDNGTGVLCNMTDGGDGFAGREKSKKEREQIRQRMLTNNPFKGKKHTAETKKKIANREYIRGNNHHFSNPTKTSFKSGKDHPFSHQVKINGITYGSISEAARELKTSNYHIKKAASNGGHLVDH